MMVTFCTSDTNHCSCEEDRNEIIGDDAILFIPYKNCDCHKIMTNNTHKVMLRLPLNTALYVMRYVIIIHYQEINKIPFL